MQSKLTILVLIIITITLSSCTKDAPIASLTFQHLFNGEVLSTTGNYQIGTDNRTAHIDHVGFYINDLKLIDNDGNEQVFEPYYLITMDNSSIELGEIDAGEYQQVTFNIGVDSVDNHNDILEISDLDNPLAAKSPSMYWAWTSGYKFLRVDGQYDTDADQMITASDSAFLLHIGLDDYFRSISVSYPFVAEEDGVVDLDIKVNYEELFNYNLNDFPQTKTGMVNDRHTAIANKVPTIFSK